MWLRLTRRQRSRLLRDESPHSHSLPLPSTAATPTLLDLPDAASATLLEYLDAPSLCAAALCCRDALPHLAEAFQRRFQLRIPPDAPRSHELRGLLARQPPLVFATQFTVTDTSHAARVLSKIAHLVRGLELASNEYTAWRPRPFRWHNLRSFTNLDKLTVGHALDRRVDLTALAHSAPRLRELVIKHAQQVCNRLEDLPLLRVLHLEDTNCDSFAVALGLPGLTSLTLLTTSRSWSTCDWLRDSACLANVVPLTKLVVRGKWQECPRAAVGVHHDTLREYAELDATHSYTNPITWWGPEWHRMAHLRSLKVGRYLQTNLAPLTALPLLEELQVAVAKQVQDCRPLRQLERLRWLHLSSAWLCDLVGFLPQLETLVWDCDSPAFPRARLWSRDRGAASSPSTLQQLVLRGYLSIDDTDRGVRAWLQRVEQVELVGNTHISWVLKSIARLRHLKRFAIRRCFSYRSRGAHVSLVSPEALEEFYFWPRGLSEGQEITAPLPLWLHPSGLPNLRVLASPFQESPVALAALCPQLTHLYLPYSLCSVTAFAHTPRESLARLCVVSLAVTEDCRWLRQERGPGRALPALQRILHPTADCLVSPTRCQRCATAVYHERERVAWKWFVDKILLPPWHHTFEIVYPDGVDEHFNARPRFGWLSRWRAEH